jgi:hypothetical protein
VGPNPTEPVMVAFRVWTRFVQMIVETFNHFRNLDYYDKFMYLYPAEATKDTAKRRLRMFLDFADIGGSNIKERCNSFAERAKKDVSRCEELVYRYPSYLKEQYEEERKISAGTIISFYLRYHLMLPFS